MKKYKPYIYSVLIALAVGGLSALFTLDGFGIYDIIASPPLSPPPIVFPIVWTVLYILMGIGAGEVYKRRETNREVAREGLLLFSVQLLLNFLWSILFFNAMQYLLCVFVLIALLVLVILMTTKFYRVSRLSGILQIPYIVWLLFALYLNVGIVFLN